jgi:hypothetical protein
MTEYKVRAPETSGTADVEDICNFEANSGWRLVSTSVEHMEVLKTRVWLFFEREVGERPAQEAWREQHGGS